MAVSDECKRKFLKLIAKRNGKFIIFKIENQSSGRDLESQMKPKRTSLHLNLPVTFLQSEKYGGLCQLQG
ncbi:hypothetical protein CMV_009342 [Castanea mollissima]|uniref:ADF-H domain-containing protein n=1 Tax=Castanea mollissima TaxID=60419 RepID=A0A8J4REI6_9ROSI|nr:hypothetical protein CMV_009342 [Castanea mollissima]